MSPIFPQNLYKDPPRCPHKPTYCTFVFLNKSRLQSYRYFDILVFLTVQSYHQIVKEFYAAESLQLAELESVLIFNISQSVLTILAKQFLFFNNAFTV